MSSTHGDSLTWQFGQCFGEKDPDEEFQEADVLSAIEYNKDGNFLATGDRGGRVVVFERADKTKSEIAEEKAQAREGASRKPGAGMPERSGLGVEYQFYTEFQSHEPEFDYLKSLEIEEKVNQIRWLPSMNDSHLLLTTNDKTVKLWKVFEKRINLVSGLNVDSGREGGYRRVAGLRIPKLDYAETTVAATPKRLFANAHMYHINSLSINSDGATWVSADDLRVNLWDMHRDDVSFTVVDIKPEDMAELSEVITCAKYHPSQCSLLGYATSKGAVRMVDLRDGATCDKAPTLFDTVPDPATHAYYSEMIASISDMNVAPNGHTWVIRDYLTVKVWDMRRPSTPVRILPVHEYLRGRLADLYDSDCIFDKFEVEVSPSGKHIMTGSYGGVVNVYDMEGTTEARIELSKTRPRPAAPRPLEEAAVSAAAAESVDFTSKVLHFSWNPTRNVAAIAGLNNLFIWNA
jgi:serine/threonine-protein phosphatase 2A regulatory subunit B